MKGKIAVALLFAVFIAPQIVQADLLLNPTFSNTAGETWTASRIAVVNQAIADWANVIAGLDDGFGGTTNVTINFTADFTNLPGSYLGRWSGSFSFFTGDDLLPWSNTVTHTIHFNAAYFSGPSTLWWDPTPADSGTDKAFADWDALTVARHEIGHMLGFTGSYRTQAGTASEFFPWVSKISANVFDPGGLNVAMEPGDVAHVAADSLLMDTTLSNIEGRIGISDTEAGMLALAYGYKLVSVPEPQSLVAVIFLSVICGSRARRRTPKQTTPVVAF